MNDFIAPIILIMTISYVTASMFIDVLPMAADTVIMCYITDIEQNNGTAKFADPKMTTFIDDYCGLTKDYKP